MKLYYAPGACSLSPHIVARELGIAVDLKEVNTKDKTIEGGGDYWKVNPRGYVPALELDNGQVLTEGPAIVQYLADQKPDANLAPKNGTMERYRLQEWLNFLTSEIHKSFSPLFKPNTPEDYKKIAKENLATRFDWLDKQLAGKDYLTGKTFTVADAYLFVLTNWTKFHNIDLARWPNIAAFQKRVGARPKAILISSAHWETQLPMLTGAAQPATIHDFFNFPDPLYKLRYPAPGSPALAQRTQSLLKAAGFTAALDGLRGLDHGAWTPLLYAYPEADVPVVQLSVQPELGPRHHLALGRALRPLSDEGVLVIGSGHLTHNLRDFDRSGRATPAPYAREFQEWVKARIEAHDYDALADYRAQSAHGVRAHPTDEHFLPLFVALGAAAGQSRPERIFDAIDGGALAMDAYVFH